MMEGRRSSYEQKKPRGRQDGQQHRGLVTLCILAAIVSSPSKKNAFAFSFTSSVSSLSSSWMTKTRKKASTMNKNLFLQQRHHDPCLYAYSLQATTAETAATASAVEDDAVVVVPDEEESNPSFQSSLSIKIVNPGESFRETLSSCQNEEEFSIVSYNMLAPYYAGLAYQGNWHEQQQFLEEDRRDRIPQAVKLIKSTNADIICLQEVEGRLPEYEHRLRELLNNSSGDGDDQHNQQTSYEMVWYPLLPQRTGDIVGLCVVWKSNKFQLTHSHGFKRGMICQLQDIRNGNGGDDNGALINIANVHLPAKPSNILGRLHTISRTIQKLDNLETTSSSQNESTLNGLMIVCGDFNGDHNSAAAKLLQQGYINYGTILDRNYRSKLTKAIAAKMRHYYPFQDVYGLEQGRIRQQCAPVTVSLKGREPGCMDQLFYYLPNHKDKTKMKKKQSIFKIQQATTDQENGGTGISNKKIVQPNVSRRTKRRIKASQRMSRTSKGSARLINNNGDSTSARIKVESILATVLETDNERLGVINRGLPNPSKGFPSDHIPIGALFTTTARTTPPQAAADTAEKVADPSHTANQIQTLNASNDDSGNEGVEARSIDESNSTPSSLTADSSSSTHQREGPPADVDNATSNQRRRGAISSTVRRRRQATIESLGYRRRHNAVLGFVDSWIKNVIGSGGLIVTDQPLYKNPITKHIKQLKKKSRAPDLICVLGNSLVVIEIAVTSSSDPTKIRNQKLSKYSDLEPILTQQLVTGGMTPDEIPNIHDVEILTFVLVDDNCEQQRLTIPDETKQDISRLVEIAIGGCRRREEEEDYSAIFQKETKRFCEQLQFNRKK